MTDIDLNNPEVQSLIEQKAKQLSQDATKGYIPESQLQDMIDKEVAGLKNKNDELLGKYGHFKDLDETQLEEFKAIQQAKAHDEFVRLVTEGKVEEAKELTLGAYKQTVKQTIEDTESQFKQAQTQLEEERGLREAAETRMSNMQKETYIRNLTQKDDSFQHEAFGDFFSIVSHNAQIDESGAVFAVENGKPVLDMDGNKKTFEDYYRDTIKRNKGIFFKTGSGSGELGTKGSTPTGKDPLKWSKEQRQQFIKEKGMGEYTQLMKNR